MVISNNLPTIGLVGGIGSGKSEVARILASEGCLICDSDALARAELNNPTVVTQLQQWWGTGIFDEEGNIDRTSIAAIIFRDATERKRLEALIHPRVETARAVLFATAAPNTRALVIDAPLLLEAGLAPQCTHIWFIETSETIRQMRVMTSRGWSADQLARRESAQWSLDRKRSAAHDVVRNEGDPASLREQVLKLLGSIPATL